MATRNDTMSGYDGQVWLAKTMRPDYEQSYQVGGKHTFNTEFTTDDKGEPCYQVTATETATGKIVRDQNVYTSLEDAEYLVSVWRLELGRAL